MNVPKKSKTEKSSVIGSLILLFQVEVTVKAALQHLLNAKPDFIQLLKYLTERHLIKHLHAVLPNNAFKTATVDRGKEFACYNNIENDINLPVFFADPYSSWQRGSNENSNGLLREFYPKRTDLALADEKELIINLFLINSRPRKCLGWNSPVKLFLHEVSHLT